MCVKYFKNFAELDCHNKIKPVPFIMTIVAHRSQAWEQLHIALFTDNSISHKFRACNQCTKPHHFILLDPTMHSVNHKIQHRDQQCVSINLILTRFIFSHVTCMCVVLINHIWLCHCRSTSCLRMPVTQEEGQTLWLLEKWVFLSLC